MSYSYQLPMKTVVIKSLLSDKKIQVCKTTKYEGFITLALDHYLEDLNPFGGGRWSNSPIRLTQISDGGPTR
jgi:hypothetical protein